jgi:hypothetical protein
MPANPLHRRGGAGNGDLKLILPSPVPGWVLTPNNRGKSHSIKLAELKLIPIFIA